MNKKLFFICPIAQLENKIRDKYGDEVYFMTALGSVFQTHNIDFTEEVCDFIRREAIEEIYIVNDTNCPFIQNVLFENRSFQSTAEEALIKLLIENYSLINAKTEIIDKVKCLMELNIQRQIDHFTSNTLLNNLIQSNGIEIYGLIHSKTEQTVLSFNHHYKIEHEL
jgi:hypothetical protein